ncbi:MAG: hisF [Chitinophagaceae bacterium]|nr:hisF [Chitinophagaceae bacterium]
MLKTRIIPVLTFNGFALVKTKKFANPRMVGNPVQAARVFNSRGVDELVFLDIYASDQNRKLDPMIVKDVIKECMMPVAVGGGISDLEDIRTLLKAGADKVVIKTKALTDPSFITAASEVFGSQCITIAVDAVLEDGAYMIYNRNGYKVPLLEFMKRSEEFGAGEFIINSVDQDGMMNGFDSTLIHLAESNTKLPVIACGGGGNLEHYKQLFLETETEAVASSSIFYFTQYTPNDIKQELERVGKPVRIV